MVARKKLAITLSSLTAAAMMAAVAGVAGAQEAPPINPLNAEPPMTAASDSGAGAIIGNGTIQLGVNPQGHLNRYGGTASSGTGTTAVGLRYMPTNAESTAPGCLCEGWGVADKLSGTTGHANVSVGGVTNMSLVSFTHDGSSAKSTVRIGSTFEVTQNYAPSSASRNVYEDTVTIKNIGSSEVEPLYRRVMDWDIEPTAFNEYVTIKRGTSTNLVYSDNNGFQSANPLGDKPSLGHQNVDVTDAGPADHGAAFDFGFGKLAPGESVTFKVFYGAAGNETDALSALGAVGAEVYSLGQPGTATGKTEGTPNTFFFGFAGVGGAPIEPPQPPANKPPTADAGGPYEVDEGGSVEVKATGTDPENGALSYAWDLDNDGAFDDASTQNATFADDDGPAAKTVKVRVTDDKGETATSEAAVTVKNVAPTITSLAGLSQALTGTNVSFKGVATDPSKADTAAGFSWEWAVDGGPYSSGSNPFSTKFSSCGSHSVSATATDKDAGVSAPASLGVVAAYDAKYQQPLDEGVLNTVQKGRVVPVKISVGCGATSLTGLKPAIQLLKGNQTGGNETASDAIETLSSSAADTTGVMRAIDGGYIYNLQVPSNAAVGEEFTVRVRPFGDSNPAASKYVVVKIRK